MSDPIAEYMAEEFEVDIDWTEKVAKQIRQQIGRELVTYIKEKEGDYRWAAGRNWIEPMLSEVCQLEEE